MKKILLIFILLFLAKSVNATCVNNGSSTYTCNSWVDLKTCAEQTSSDGDIIYLEAGDYTADSTITIPNTKGVEIIGTGIGQTRISGTADPKFLLLFDANRDTFSRISGIEFYSSTTALGVFVGQTVAYGPESVRRYRIDNCKFNYHLGVGLSGNAYGVVDSSEFLYSSGTASYILWVDGKTGRMIKSFGTSGSNDFGWQSREESVKFGTEYFHVVENCIFHLDKIKELGQNSNWNDGKMSAKLMFRYNKIHNGGVPGGHDSCPSFSRGWLGSEIYGNNFTTSEQTYSLNSGRGGAWLVYDNIFKIHSLELRSPLEFQNPIYRYPGPGGCQDVWANNCDSINEKFCIKYTVACTDDSQCDQVPGDRCVNVDGNPYPCRDQVGFIDNDMTPHPWISWNNIWCEGSSECVPNTYIGFSIRRSYLDGQFIEDPDNEILKLERDVLDDVSGAGGLPVCEDEADNEGSDGSDMNDPTCQQFWDPVNHRKKDYVPLQYPHPLVSGENPSDLTPPANPTGLSVS